MTLPGPAWLFCPGDRPDRYRKALAVADLVIIDLEDAVSSDKKAAAREAMISEALDPDRVIVRINPAGTPDHAADVAALNKTRYRTVMLAKTEHTDELTMLANYSVVALIETPGGVVNAVNLAASPGVIAMMWGAEDLVAAMGGQSSRFADGRYRDVARHARASVLLAAHAKHKQAVDSVYIDINDLAGLAEEAADASASGFSFKACIHPSQAEVIRTAFRPTPEMTAWAQRVMNATQEVGAVSVDGQMIDAPLIRQAQRILRTP